MLGDHSVSANVENTVSPISHLQPYVSSPVSNSGTRKSIWDYYNDMTKEKDEARKAEWADFINMILLLVSSPFCFIV